MKLGRFAWVLLGVALVGAVAYYSLRTVSDPDDESLVVGYQPNLIYLPVFTGVEQRIFAERGLSVELVEFPSANEMMQALLAGHIDVTGMSSLSVVASAAEQNPDVLALITVEIFAPNASPDAVLVQMDSGVQSFEDLRDKRIGTWRGSTIAAYTRTILESVGMTEQDVEIIPMGREEMLTLFASGQIDAAFTFEPFVSALVEQGASVLERGALSRRLLGAPNEIYPGGGVVLRSTMHSRAETIQRYLDSYEAAVEWIHDDWPRALTFLAKYSPGQPPPSSRMSWEVADERHAHGIQALLDLYRLQGIVEADLRAVDLLPPGDE